MVRLNVISELILYDTDVHALAVNENNVYLALQSSEPVPAQLAVFSLRNNQLVSLQKTIGLPSYAAVAVKTNGNNIYVAYGNVNGGVAIIDKNKLTLSATFRADDIRALDVKGDNVYALQGNPANIYILDKQNLSQRSVLSYTASNQPEAKASIQVANNGKTAAVSAGLNGLQLIELSSGGLFYTESLNSGLDIVCNSAAFAEDLLFMANGAAGLTVLQYYGDLHTSHKPLLRKKASLSLNGSTNMVAYANELLFVTDGKSGTKVIRVKKADKPYDTGINITASLKATVKVLAAEITNGPNGPRVPVYVNQKLNGKYTPLFGGANVNNTTQTFEQTIHMSSGDHLGFKASASGCYAYDSDNKTTAFVKTLENGDSFPNYKAYAGQKPLADILKDYIDPNGKLVLADNQLLIAYELGTNDIRSAAADFQDCVLLITFDY